MTDCLVLQRATGFLGASTQGLLIVLFGTGGARQVAAASAAGDSDAKIKSRLMHPLCW